MLLYFIIHGLPNVSILLIISSIQYWCVPLGAHNAQNISLAVPQGENATSDQSEEDDV